jgi:hypothetical protein
MIPGEYLTIAALCAVAVAFALLGVECSYAIR